MNRKAELKRDLTIVKMYQENTTDYKARIALGKLAHIIRAELQTMGANHG